MNLPLIVSTPWIIVTFVVEIAFLHLVLVVLPWFRLTARQWKKVQYITLALGSLAVLGAVSSARQLAAKNMYDFTAPRVENDYRLVRQFADDYATMGMVCRTFVRGPYSPPAEAFNRAQHEFDQACEWFKQLAAALPKEPPTDDGEISWSTLPAPPNFAEDILVENVRQFRNTLATYDDSAKRHRELAVAAQQSDLEKMLVLFGPLFLSFALALQITKVTGELRAM